MSYVMLSFMLPLSWHLLRQVYVHLWHLFPDARMHLLLKPSSSDTNIVYAHCFETIHSQTCKPVSTHADLAPIRHSVWRSHPAFHSITGSCVQHCYAVQRILTTRSGTPPACPDHPAVTNRVAPAACRRAHAEGSTPQPVPGQPTAPQRRTHHPSGMPFAACAEELRCLNTLTSHVC